jgi:hypothetical protein
MELSNRTKYELRNLTVPLYNNYPSNYYTELLPGDMYSKMFILENIWKGGYEVPICMVPILNLINEEASKGTSEGKSYKELNSIVYPLYHVTSRNDIKTTKSLLNHILTNQAPDKLIKCTTSTGFVYYGQRGMFLDSDYNILFLCTCTFKEVQEGECLEVDKVNIYINPKVFSSNDLLSKAIIKALIPFYSEYVVNIHTLYKSGQRVRSTLNCKKATLIIEDVTSKYIHSTIKPKNDSINEELNNLASKYFTFR